MKPSIAILRVAFTIAIIDEDPKLRVLTVKSSVVNAKSYILPQPYLTNGMWHG